MGTKITATALPNSYRTDVVSSNVDQPTTTIEVIFRDDADQSEVLVALEKAKYWLLENVKVR